MEHSYDFWNEARNMQHVCTQVSPLFFEHVT